MDPSAEIIVRRVDPSKKPRMDGRCSPRSASAAVYKVLDTDDLLIEILLRVGFPTTLVRAALVCRHWLRHASDHVFLRRFRELHPPRLLGFYINPGETGTKPRFVPMLPQPPELAAVLRPVNSVFDNDNRPTYINDCRNGRILINQYKGRGRSMLEVHAPLNPERAMAIPWVPGPQPQDGSFIIYHQILSKEEEGGSLSYLYVLMHLTIERKYMALVYTLQDGVWCMNNLSIDQIPHAWTVRNSVLVGNKIYMPAVAVQRDMVVLDLTASSFATVQLPQGVEYGSRKAKLSSAGDGDGVYLVHVKELQLSVWLHDRDGWLMVDTICLHEMCANLSMLDYSASLQLKYVGENVEFVFLEMGQCLLYWDVKRMTVRKEYEMKKEDRCLGDIFPYMMIWPPTFPSLKD